jgi:parvulin-like peptidyl-prolyl isomerase
MKRLLSALLALTMALSLCVGCGSTKEEPTGIYYEISGVAPDETVMTVDGNDIPAQLYFYWAMYTASSLEYQLQMYNTYYGLYSELFDEDGNLLWDVDFYNDMNLAEYVADQADTTAKLCAVVENMADEYGVTLTEDDEAEIAETVAAAEESQGGVEEFDAYLEQMGIDRTALHRLYASNYYFEGLTDLVLDENSDLYMEDADYDQYATYADHILLATIDLDTQESLSDEEIAAKRQTAEDLLAQLRASDDPITLFAQLADEYSEDTGRATNPDGYVFGDGEMVTEFEEAAKALSVGEISDIVESPYGYHILLRKDLAEYLNENSDEKETYAQEHLEEVLTLASENAEVTRSETLDTIDWGSFYADYTAKVAEMTAAETDSTEDSEAAGDGTDDTQADDESGEETEGQ